MSADHPPRRRCRLGAVAGPLGPPACAGPRCDWSGDFPQRPRRPPSAVHELLDLYSNDEMKMRPVGFEPTKRTHQSFLGRPPLTARQRAHGLRPAGFEPAITPTSEGRVRRIISPVRCLATLRARLRLADLRSVAAELSSARVSSAAHRIAPPGFEPGTPGPKPGRMDRFPTGLPNARTRARGPPAMASPKGRGSKTNGTRNPCSAYNRGTTFA